jgi:hypothetical protein
MILICSKQSGNLTARQRIQADADRAPIDSTNIGQKQQSARALCRQIRILASQHVRRASDAFVGDFIGVDKLWVCSQLPHRNDSH